MIRLKGRRGDPIEYRPHAQHRLQLRDDSFDLRYSAYLWNEALVEVVYSRTLERIAQGFIEKAITPILNDATKSCDEMPSSVIVQATTDLSDFDRSQLMIHLTRFFTMSKKSHQAIVELPLEASNLSHSHFLHALVTALWQQVPNGLQAQVVPSSSSALTTVEEVEKTLQAIVGPQGQLLVFLPYADRLSPSVFAAVVKMCSQQSLPVTFLCITDHLSEHLTTDDASLRGHSRLHRVPLASAYEVFLALYSSLFVKGKLPLQFPAIILRRLWSEFQDGLACCGTFIRRVLLAIRLHVRQRRGLIMMVQEFDWLRSMNLLSRGIGEDELEKRAWTELLGILDPRDLEDSALAVPKDFLQDSPSQLDCEVAWAKKQRRVLHSQRLMTGKMLETVQRLTDRILPVAERRRFHLCYLWPEFWAGLHLLVKKQAKLLPAEQIRLVIQSILVLWNDDTISGKVSDQWLSFSEKQKRCLSRQLRGWQGLKDEVRRSPSLSRSGDIDAWLRLSCLEIAKKSEVDTGFYFNRCVEVLISREGEGEADNRNCICVSDEKISLELHYILDQLLEDFADWVLNVSKEYSSLYSLDGWEGLSCLAQESAQEALNGHFNGCIRSRFMEGLRQPKPLCGKRVKDFQPDVCALYEPIKSARSMEVATKWLPLFEEQVQATVEPARKRMKENPQSESSLKPEMMMKMRFASCLHDIERSGIIGLRVNAKKVTLVVKQLYGGI
eukprot:scaffold601_cov170-Ochromonas_danica.AAC.58